MEKAFTLLELTVVLVIIGILAAIGLPSYAKVIERSRAAEGTSILGALRAAQLRYYDEFDAYANGAEGDFSMLDVNVTTPKFFEKVTAYDDGLGKVAYLVRNSSHNDMGTFGNYKLYIHQDGTITCTDTTQAACTALGLQFE